jgi:DNA-binding CsgD family transcriptional regulator
MSSVSLPDVVRHRPPTRGPDRRPRRTSDLAAIVRELITLTPADEPVLHERELVAEFCRFVGERLGKPTRPGDGLAPRVQQTLDRLLQGDSEKQIAARLGISPHTVHVYVKSLYRHYGVCSRGELLARFVRCSSV